MSSSGISPGAEVDRDSAESRRRREYVSAFGSFRAGLKPKVRKQINGSGSPDWPSNRTFALPVNEESAAYRMDDADPVIETLNELAMIRGATTKIALWLSDKADAVGVVGAAGVVEQFRLAVARICEAKNPRLEALLVSLAIGMNLHGNANGYAIADHFNLKPQTIHESLAETCAALGLPKPLSKANKARYAGTQYRHNLQKTAAA